MKIVIVDDEPVNLMLLEAMAQKEGYQPIAFDEPAKAIEYFAGNDADLLITDYNMPFMDGLTLFKAVKKDRPDIMSIMITASGEETVRIQALEEGINDFLTKPLFPAEFMLRMRNILQIRKAIILEKEFSQKLASEVERATAKLSELNTALNSANVSLTEVNKALSESEHEALRILSKTAEYKDPETGSHIARVAHYSKLLGKRYGLDEREQELLFYGAPLHDIGKVGIEDAILLKPGKLDEDEFIRMKTHSTLGYEILADARNPYLAAGAIIALSHHEKYDGSGYPQGLQGSSIPLYGRIVAIADVFDALTSIRPYKRAWSFEESMELIRNEKGKHFDPVLADLFIESEEEIREIFIRFAEE